VVDATVQASAKQVRVAARLVEVATGTQLWSDKFESGLEDLFELQDRISKRIAEALRVELAPRRTPRMRRRRRSSLYLRGRRKLTAFQVIGTDGAIELLEQCIELAPHLQPALACHAIACLRAWFMPSSFLDDEKPRDWEQEARRSVARALEEAPDTAETYLARAMLGVQLGEWREAVKALVKALEIAPTYAHAHQYLAQLQCEAGNTKEGLERAQLAFDLEPSLTVCLFDIARLHALRGDRAECDRYLDLADQLAVSQPDAAVSAAGGGLVRGHAAGAGHPRHAGGRGRGRVRALRGELRAGGGGGLRQAGARRDDGEPAGARPEPAVLHADVPELRRDLLRARVSGGGAGVLPEGGGPGVDRHRVDRSLPAAQGHARAAGVRRGASQGAAAGAGDVELVTP
jgi:tetratricopeptide (TPR) repeat protein